MLTAALEEDSGSSRVLASDMGHHECPHLFQQGLHHGRIQTGGLEQVIDQQAFFRPVTGFSVCAYGGQHPSNQAEAIAVHTAAGDTDDTVASPDAVAINEVRLLHDSDTESGGS